ncbi:hypothetical protein [Kitasatospora sp. NPDC059571]|uniref:hypothetical protein n=1 Tax=Kitasatospora sp. NPDC059571 TaxID=3346871 RepID=UPI0036C881F0
MDRTDRSVIDRTRTCLELHRESWGSELDPDAGARAAWHLHKATEQLLTLTEELLEAERPNGWAGPVRPGAAAHGPKSQNS